MHHLFLLFFIGITLACSSSKPLGELGTRVFVVERDNETLTVYDYQQKKVVGHIEKLGDLKHATMVFSQDLHYGYIASRNGKLSRIDLHTLALDGQIETSQNSIDTAISQDGRTLAVAEYIPGGVTLIDTQSFKVIKKIPAQFTSVEGKEMDSRVTGIVDAPKNKLVCVTIEGKEIWIIDTQNPDMSVEFKTKTLDYMPYDAMITPDGRYYLVGHVGTNQISVLDLKNPSQGIKAISLEDPNETFEKKTPVKLPHMASWAVANDHVFVPLVGEKRLVVLNKKDWSFKQSIPLQGHPVYSVRSPTESEIWVSFSGEHDDSFIQVIDTETLVVTHTIPVGKRIYHLDFTPRGAHVLVTANKDNKLFMISGTTYQIEDEQNLRSPSGIFGVWRVNKLGL